MNRLSARDLNGSARGPVNQAGEVKMRRKVAAAGLMVSVVLAALSPPVAGAACPTRTPPGAFASAAKLRETNRILARVGARPTASPAHKRFVAWIDRNLREIPGLRQTEQRYVIRRWSARSNALRAEIDGAPVALPTAGPIPYSEPTGAAGVSAPLAYVPAGTPITAANAAGRVVVREASPGSVPLIVFDFLKDFLFDPAGSINLAGEYRRDFLAYGQHVGDLEDAAGAGAAGLAYFHELPRSLVAGHLAPYEGTVWGVPGVYLGVDEGTRLRDAILSGHATSARITVDAGVSETSTKTLLATLPGHSDRRVVIESHTDGTNAYEDNGPIAMLAMARYLASLPERCRPRDVQFVFQTGHWFQRLANPSQRHGGAGQFSRQLDHAYDRGKVAAVVVLEHLGALQYDALPRSGGRPGLTLRRTGKPELALVFTSRSARLIAAVKHQIVAHHLTRSFMIQGADAPVAGQVPPHCSFGGEGTPYNERLLPTVATIAAPIGLYDPVFGLKSIDFRRMRAQALAYTDLTMKLERMAPKAIAGDVTEFRRQRRTGAPTCEP